LEEREEGTGNNKLNKLDIEIRNISYRKQLYYMEQLSDSNPLLYSPLEQPANNNFLWYNKRFLDPKRLYVCYYSS